MVLVCVLQQIFGHQEGFVLLKCIFSNSQRFSYGDFIANI